MAKFAKGHIPHNKGKKGWTNSASFQKNNTFTAKRDDLPNGTIRERKWEIWIKIDNNWIRYARYVYAQHHGINLSRKDKIVFIDGNKKNCNIKNLYCQTIKKEYKKLYDKIKYK